MIVREIVKKRIVLEIDEKQTEWLRGIMQNPINVKFPADEEGENRGMRETFFRHLNQILGSRHEIEKGNE